MAKIPRTHIAGAIYYVTSRGDNEEVIFKDKEDYQKYLELLIKYKKQYGFGLFAFVLLPSHLHLLIELKKGLTLSDIMHDLNANYTKYFNGRYQSKGHLFQERYKMNLLEKSAQLLLYMIAYLHLNPKILGLVSDCKDYAYSSYPLYIGKETQNLNYAALNMGNEIKEVLEYLGGKNYAKYLESIPKTEIDTFSQDLVKKPILGSDEFIAKINLEIKERQLAVKPSSQLASEHKKNRRVILIGGLAILILGIFTFYLYAKTTLGLKEGFKEELKNKDMELAQRLAQQKIKITTRFMQNELQGKRDLKDADHATEAALESSRVNKLEGLGEKLK